MSQQKVDAHKKEKQGKKAQVAKQKLQRKIARIVALIVAVLIVAGIVALVIYNRTKADADLAEDTAIESEIDGSDYDLLTEDADTAEEPAEAPAE